MSLFSAEDAAEFERAKEIVRKNIERENWGEVDGYLGLLLLEVLQRIGEQIALLAER